MQNTSEQMKSVVRYMRKTSERAMRNANVRGREIAASPAEGRNAACWLHQAKGKGPRPVVFEIHGGGFALGDARKEDALREWIRDCFDVHVVGVEYRHTPEHPAPAAVEDVAATIAYIASSAECEVDASRMVAIGFSAGASLALAACFKLAEGQRTPKLSALALHYPFLDADTPPVESAVRDIDLPYDMMVAFNEWYAVDLPTTSPYVSPVFASDAQLAALPSLAIYPVVGDQLFDQSQRLRARMQAIGIDVAWHPVEGEYHGYIEDAANVEYYEAQAVPETLASRPKNYLRDAESSVRASLEEALDMQSRDIAFNGGREVAQ